jgi:hypothetical protein
VANEVVDFRLCWHPSQTEMISGYRITVETNALKNLGKNEIIAFLLHILNGSKVVLSFDEQ